MSSFNSKQKIGRNDPCYCGSNLKYKKCHLNRHLEPEVTEGQVRGFASKQRVNKSCFHSTVDGSNCAGKIIEAHTVSKSGSLRKIARNGKVYNFKPDINSLFDNNGKFVLRELGVSQASTFPGFCAHHDKQLFSPIEDRVFEADTYTTSLLGYRAISREIYAKQHQMQGIPFLKTMDKGKSTVVQEMLQNILGAHEEGIGFGLRDLLLIKKSYDIAFQSNDFSSARFVVIQFTEPPHILYSGSIYPECDFAGNLLQDLGSSKELDGISINAISTPNGGAVVFHWFGRSNTNENFIKSLLALPKNVLANALTQFAFEFLENLFISPTWWDALEMRFKNILEGRVMHMEHSPKCLIPDGGEYFLWSSPEITTNIT